MREERRSVTIVSEPEKDDIHHTITRDLSQGLFICCRSFSRFEARVHLKNRSRSHLRFANKAFPYHPEIAVGMIERDFEGTSVGICLDFGHAHLMGDVADAVETVAEHLITTHVHDNRGRDDDHLVPYQGSIDWASALVHMQKIGYDGTYLLELANTGSTAAVLEEARRARQRMERALAD